VVATLRRITKAKFEMRRVQEDGICRAAVFLSMLDFDLEVIPIVVSKARTSFRTYVR
jgi:hypothetical protein